MSADLFDTLLPPHDRSQTLAAQLSDRDRLAVGFRTLDWPAARAINWLVTHGYLSSFKPNLETALEAVTAERVPACLAALRAEYAAAHGLTIVRRPEDPV